MIMSKDRAAYDAVVVGAGPAGLSCAAEIASLGGRVVVVEQGKAHRERDRYLDILSGVGGAGLFSDGKHSFFPAATALWQLSDRHALDRAYERTVRLLHDHGVHAEKGELTSSSLEAGWHLKKYPSIYASLDQRRKVVDDLFDQCGERPWLESRVIGCTRDHEDDDDDASLLRLDVETGEGERRRIETRNLVIATGRLSPRPLRSWLSALRGVRYEFRRLEFGVRLEMDARAHLFQTTLAGLVDPKLTLDLDPHAHALTFCTCRDGEIVNGVMADVQALSGRADGPQQKTGRSSIGVLVRVTDESRANRIEDALFQGCVPITTPLAPLAGAEKKLLAMFGEEGAELVARALRRFADAFLVRNEIEEAVILHAPCIEGVGAYPVSDEHLQIAPNVFVAGDVSGRFRGIVASLVSGRYVAQRLMSASAR
jgi:uncharacterized protein